MEKIEGLILPRNYLSYSQMMCWIGSKDRFRREYFEKGRKLDTKFFKFGKGIAKMIENGTYKDVLPNLEVLGTPEYKVITNVCGVPVLGFIDDYAEELFFYQEFKTGKLSPKGKAPWDKAKVQKHKQLPFYATLLKWKTGKMPKKCRLVWMETEEASGELDIANEDEFFDICEKKLSLTGKIVSFDREFDEREIETMEKLIVKSAIEISNAYKAFISEI